MSDDDRPSISELQRRLGIPWRAWPSDATRAIEESAPVLLEIAAAALAWRDQRLLNLQAALMRTESEIEAEAQDVQRERVRSTADLASALETALAKVRP